MSKVGALFGVTDERRHEVLSAMFRATADRADRTGYWFQLLLATGIATLGLVLDSTGVVIGAMLVAPLMGPIVHLAMGLVIGSAVLVLHAATRVLASIGAVIAAACALTWLLPFHEATREIAARTSPTALDLGVAAFCALAGGFSTTRPGTETAATAAGTSIGISLVPPLCVVGFAIGVGSTSMAEGAGLLFVTNLSAILLCCAVFFAAIGFRGADTEAPVAPRASSPVDRAVAGVRSLFGREYGVVMRIGLPLVLVLLVFAPLREALVRVSWEVRTRSAVRSLVNRVIPPETAVQSRLDVAHGRISVRVIMVDRSRQARAAREELSRHIERVTGITPDVDIIGVPDFDALREATLSLRAETPLVEPAPRPDPEAIRRRVEAVFASSWPPDAPRLGRWRLELTSAAVAVEVQHEGEPLGRAAESMLARDLSAALGVTVTVRDVAHPPRVTSAAGEGRRPFIAHLVAMLASLRHDPTNTLCVTRPVVDGADAAVSPDPFDDAVEAVLSAETSERVVRQQGAGWRAELTIGPCANVAPRDVDGGAPDRDGAMRE